jgi:hypothetical protein
MSDLFGTTSTSASAPTATYDRTGYEPTSADRTDPGRTIGNVQVEEPRRHPLTYAALALSLLALILSIAALSTGNNSDIHRVRVGNNDCYTIDQTSGPGALYCRTGALPNG